MSRPSIVLAAALAASACASGARSGDASGEPGATIATCGEDEMPRVDGSCVAVGAVNVPTSPPACPLGKLALPGEAACREVMPCPPGAWPTTDGARVYVDGARTDGDGSEARPFQGLQAAIDAAPAGATIVVTTGTYDARLTIARPTKIVGRCPGAVQLVGSGGFSIDAKSDLELSGVSVRGAGVGVGVLHARVVLDRVWIHDTGDRAIDVEDIEGPAELLVRDSLIEGAHDVSVFASGGRVSIERSAIRGTKPAFGGKQAQGVQARSGERSGSPSALTLRRSVVEDHVVFGVNVIDSTALVEDCVLRGTVASAESPAAGLTVQRTAKERSPSLVLRRTLLERHQGAGLDLSESRGTLEDVWMRDLGGEGGVGVLVHLGEAEITRFTAESIVGAGVVVKSGTLTLTSARIRDVRQTPKGNNGAGVIAEPSGGTSSHVALADVLVERAEGAGILVIGSTGEARDVAVRATLPTGLGTLGDGIAVLTPGYVGALPLPAELTLSRAILEGNARAGLVLFGASAKIGQSILCNPIDIDVERVIGVRDGDPIEHPFKLEDLGENRCGCLAKVSCAARSAGLKPLRGF